jgi:hypothetical protein
LPDIDFYLSTDSVKNRKRATAGQVVKAAAKERWESEMPEVGERISGKQQNKSKND